MVVYYLVGWGRLIFFYSFFYILFTRPEGAPRSGWLGQYDRGGLHKSPRRALLEAPLHFSGTPLGMGTAQPAFDQSKACARKIEPGCSLAVMRQYLPRRVDSPSSRTSPGHLQDIYLKRCKSRAVKIIKDSNHPCNHLFILLPSGKRFRSMMAKTERLRRSFFPQAIRLLNSNSNSVSLHLHLHD